jgi:hypothetical protein
MNRSAKSSSVVHLIWMLDEAYDKQSWHGPNLKGSLRGIDHRAAAWRPAKKRHNIWEIAIHAAYWKYVVRRRLSAEKRGSFEVPGSNWFVRPCELTSKAWKSDLRILERSHQELRKTVAELTDGDLKLTPGGSQFNNESLIRGVAFHDIYHAGQIQLLKRMMRDASRR